MSKLTVANLYHSLRELSASSGLSSRTAHLIGENLWRLTAKSDSAEGLIDLSDLMSAVHFVFEATEAEPSSRAGDFAAWRLQQSERQLRFDPEHRGRLNTHGFHAPFVPEPAGQALRKGLGEAQAREQLEQQHWIVIVVDAQAPSAEFPPELLQALHARQRILVLWCDEHSPDARPPEYRLPSAVAFEQLSADRDLMCLGPIGGLEMDGVVAVLEGLKALEKPAVLHLRLRADLPQSESAAAAPCETTSFDLAVRHFSRLAQSNRRVAAVNLLPSGEQAKRLSDAGFPRQIADAEAIAWCAGLADGGCRPFVWLDDDAIDRYWGPIVELIGDAQRPVAIVATASCSDLRPRAIVFDQLRSLPGAAIMAPSDAAELTQMLAFATSRDGPSAIWLPAQLGDAIAESSAFPLVEVGQAALVRSGLDIGLLALGDGVRIARKVAERLAAAGVNASLINLRFASPLDERAILQLALQTRSAALIEGTDSSGAFASDVMAVLSSRGNEKPVALFKPYNRHDSAEQYIQEIVARCLRLTESAVTDSSIDSFEFDNSAQPLQQVQSLSASFSPQEEYEQILAKRFSPDVQRWIEDYSAEGDRSLYLWKWCLHGVELTTLPFVPDELRSDACDTKFLSGMLNVLLDDVADKKRNGDLLDELFKVVGGNAGNFDRFADSEREYAALTCRLWGIYWQRARRYPAFEAHRELLQYDLAQLFNTVRYSQLVNRDLSLLNIIEHDNYSAQGMGLMSFSTIDLMCAPDFPRRELSPLREAMWHAQWMARIGNLVTTWQREIGDGDYSSGVFARAVGRHDLTVEQLEQGDAGEIESAVRRGRHETFFLHRWERHRRCLQTLAARIQSFDLNVVIHGLERLLQTELGSRGFK